MLPKAKAKPYTLLGKAFTTKKIIVLSVQDCRLEICGDIDLLALRKLYLGQIQCDDQ